ncbi:hypothetical protein [Streptomyces wuyuanensis]|uniref:hypothetical protein n=1 Tax=Streptomyces wuyuanensis TaxID=1196353 RepID=UPI003427060F
MSLALATAFLCCAVGTVVIAFAADDVQQSHSQSRAPRFTGKFPGERAIGHWRQSGDTVGELQHSVIFIAPLNKSAPPPPGLSSWPERGEAVLSPALAAAGEREGITHRYGRDAGRISAEGLTSPSERLAYVRPEAAKDGEWDKTTEISGFGDLEPMPFGDSITVVGADAFMAAVVGFLGLPAAILTVVAARSGSVLRDRRMAVLNSLGGTFRHRALVCLGEALWPVTAGAALGLLPLLVAAYADLTLPLTGYTIASSTVRAWLPAALLGTAAAAATVLVTTILLHQSKAEGRSPRTLSGGRAKRRYALLCALGIIMAMPVNLGPLSADYRVSIMQYTIGMVLALATLPAVIAWTMTSLGQRLANRSRAKRRPGGLIAGRWLHSYPAVIARLVVAVVVGLGVVSQIQLWTSRTTVAATEARGTFATLGESVLITRSRSQPEAQVTAFEKDLGRGHTVFALIQEPNRPSTLVAPCPHWTAIGLPCPSTQAPIPSSADRRLHELKRWEGGGTGEMRYAAGDVSAPGSQRAGDAELKLVVISEQGDPTVSNTVRQAAYRHLGMAPVVNVLAGMQLGGALQYETIANWVTLLGLWGMLMMALAAAISALAEFQMFSTRLAPVGVLAGDTRVFRSTALWYLSAPIAVAGIAGALVSTVLGYPMVTTGGASWAPELTVTAVLGTTLLAVLIGLVGGRSVIARITRWEPAAD